MTFRFAICDDEQIALTAVSGILVNKFSEHGVTVKADTYAPEQGLADVWCSKAYDAIFLDINMPEQDGVKIAFISYTYGLNGMTLSASSELYIPLIDEAEIVRMVDKAETLADMVFVVMHWGDENKFTASAEQKQLASAISAAGAAAIIGMHSHTVQPVEWIDNADGSRTLVIYSLGNLISTMLANFNMVGGIVTFDIVEKDGVCSIENPIFNPTVTHYDKDRLNLQVYMLEDYTEELAASHGTSSWGTDKRFSLDIAKGFVTSTISPEFLPDFLK